MRPHAQARTTAHSTRDAAHALLTVGILAVPGVEEHAAAVQQALRPWIGGHMMPNLTFEADLLIDAYDDRTLARLRSAIRTYDPWGRHRHRTRADHQAVT